MSSLVGTAITWLDDLYVFDSSGIIAYLDNEPGGDLVANILLDPNARIFAHSVNLCEVIYHFGPQSVAKNQADAQKALATLKSFGVVERADLDEDFRDDLALLISERRAMPPDPAKPKHRATLALGDAFGLALARRLGATFVTADRGEIEPMAVAGFCRVIFIR